jgi:hypothetical protein
MVESRRHKLTISLTELQIVGLLSLLNDGAECDEGNEEVNLALIGVFMDEVNKNGIDALELFRKWVDGK